jgi:hypothetical protein
MEGEKDNNICRATKQQLVSILRRKAGHLLVRTKTIRVVIDRQFLIFDVSRSSSILSFWSPLGLLEGRVGFSFACT